MQQFFVEKLEAPFLDSKQFQQCQKVLRMRKGDQIRIVDLEGKGILAEFVDDGASLLKEIEPLTWAPKQHKLRLIASLIRTERLEWMIQKACECGVDEIVLLQAERCVVRDFGKREDRKMERLNLIAKEACEQSYRQYPVSVKGITTIQDLEQFKSEQNIYADLGNHEHIVNAIDMDCKSLSVIVGPEGGFSDKERSFFNQNEWQCVSLGNQVFRAETASMFVCNMVSVCEVVR